ncbi:MAG: RadC family protein [Luteibaculaceae bacterium]
MTYEPKNSIKSWNEDDRPREKLLLKGKSALSDAELLAILLGSGSVDEDAVQLARKVLLDVDNNLSLLAQKNVDELKKHKGIGEAKAVSIVAAMELGRRKKDTQVESPKITSSKDAYVILKPYFEDLQHEEFRTLLLNRNNKVIANSLISAGGITGTVVDSRIIFKDALLKNATSIILAHNHPSGALSPSKPDLDLTESIRKAGVLLNIPVLDHIIVTNTSYYSFADQGKL